MPYITGYLSPQTKQLSLFDMMDPQFDDSCMKPGKDFHRTRTIYTEHVEPRLMSECHKKCHIEEAMERLKRVVQLYGYLTGEIDRHYKTFRIPKEPKDPKQTKREFRTLNQADEELEPALLSIRGVFEQLLPFPYHTAAYGYVRKRCTYDAVQRHQFNKSEYFLLMDYSKFFDHISYDFAWQQISMIFPFSEIIKVPVWRETLENALKLCFLRGGLPQGSPLSPLLTNIVMLPLDYHIAKLARKENVVYTRYADDMAFSARHNFRWIELKKNIQQIMDRFHMPIQFNEKKTKHYKPGQPVWILGLRYSNGGTVTIGHKNRRKLRSTLFNFFMDYSNGNLWPAQNLFKLQGNISYYKNVYKEETEKLLEHYGRKFHCPVQDAIKQALAMARENPVMSGYKQARS